MLSNKNTEEIKSYDPIFENFHKSKLRFNDIEDIQEKLSEQTILNDNSMQRNNHRKSQSTCKNVYGSIQSGQKNQDKLNFTNHYKNMSFVMDEYQTTNLLNTNHILQNTKKTL